MWINEKPIKKRVFFSLIFRNNDRTYILSANKDISKLKNSRRMLSLFVSKFLKIQDIVIFFWERQRLDTRKLNRNYTII